ncbi:MAG: S-layer homology domain-containing protein, partial [Pseudoflavonifractor sp.]
MRKKLLSLLLCIAMVASMVTIPAMGAGPDVTAIRFSDLAGHWAEKSIIRWTDYGVVRGDPAGTFRPNADLSRREMATILSNFLHLTVKAENVDTRDYLTVKGYPWHVEAVLKCAAAGIMNGDEGLAKAGSSVTRQEAMVMLGIALGITPAPKADLAAFTDGATVADWAAGYVTALTKAGIVAGVGKNRIAPLANISRASVLSILDRAVSDYIAAPGTYDKVVGTGIVAVVVPDVILKGNKIAGSLLV